MELVPLNPEQERPDQGTSTALVPLATTALRRTGGELPPVCLQLSSSTLIGLRVYLDEFLRLASGEMASVIAGARDDVEVITRQTDIVQGALNEQSRSSRTATVIESAELPAIIAQSLEIVPDRCRELVRIEDPDVGASA